MYNTITMCNNNTTIQTVSVKTVYSLYILYRHMCIYIYLHRYFSYIFTVFYLIVYYLCICIFNSAVRDM